MYIIIIIYNVKSLLSYSVLFLAASVLLSVTWTCVVVRIIDIFYAEILYISGDTGCQIISPIVGEIILKFQYNNTKAHLHHCRYCTRCTILRIFMFHIIVILLNYIHIGFETSDSINQVIQIFNISNGCFKTLQNILQIHNWYI